MIRRWFIRFQALRQAQRIARDAFRQAYPNEHIAWVTLRAEESDRYVIERYYGRTRPPRYIFYAVSKNGDQVYAIENDTAYRPTVWR